MVKIGKIVNTQGIKGEVRVLSNSDFKDIRFVVGNILQLKIKDEFIDVEIQKYYVHKNFDILKFKDLDNINDVLKLKNSFIYGKELEESVLESDEYFVSDLINLRVYNQNDIELGKIIEVIDNSPQMLFKVESIEGKKFLVPFVDEFILDVDLKENKITVNVIKGLIDEN